jgi:hypothetical protein
MNDIRAGLSGAQPARGEDKRARRIAAAFRPNDNYERLIAMRTDDPANWERLGSSLHIAVGMYEEQKATHARVTQEGTGYDPDPAAA